MTQPVSRKWWLALSIAAALASTPAFAAKDVVVAVGSGGTMAGLVVALGADLLGRPGRPAEQPLPAAGRSETTPSGLVKVVVAP